MPTVTSAKYHTEDQAIIEAVIDNIPMHVSVVSLDIGGYIPDAVNSWLKAGNKIAPYEPPPAPPPAPVTITKVQGMIQLHRSGLTESFKAAVSKSPELQIWFEHSPTWDESHPRVSQVLKDLGLSDKKLKKFFSQASEIE
jgi:hypothetical protein